MADNDDNPRTGAGGVERDEALLSDTLATRGDSNTRRRGAHNSWVDVRAALLAVILGVGVGCGGNGEPLDGPVMRYPTSAGGGGNEAEVKGRLELAGGCLYIALESTRYPVVWPAGTTWDADEKTVIGPSNKRMPVGSDVYGSGGYLKAEDVKRALGAEAEALAARCVDNRYGEVAFINNDDDDAIGPAE